jgi:hypothetical protein
MYCALHRRWQATAGREGEAVHVNHNVTNFEFLYEPFYVAPDTVPAHDERFIGYGYTRNTQVSLPIVASYRVSMEQGPSENVNSYSNFSFTITLQSEAVLYS